MGHPHRGTDFAAPGGTPIYAIADGIVSAARAMNSYGNCVQVSHGTADDGHRYDSLYAHMSSITVAEGTAVQKGGICWAMWATPAMSTAQAAGIIYI